MHHCTLTQSLITHPSLRNSYRKWLPTDCQNYLAAKKCFPRLPPQYKQALHNSGFSENINYLGYSTTYASDYKKKKRSCNIIRFNPPFCDSFTTNIGKEFFSLLAKHFPASNRLHKIINKQNVKLSYSSLTYMQGIIANHNKRVLNKSTSEERRAPSCNCRDKANCPLNDFCRKKSIIYKASVDTIWQGNDILWLL